MSSISAIQSALSGIQQNQSKMTNHAQNISKWGTGSNQETGGNDISLSSELVGIKEAALGYNMNIQVLRLNDETLGSLIDALA